MAKNKAIVLSVIASLTLMLLLIGATYAYFQAKTDSGSPADVKVQTYTVDVLSFETGDPLSFTIDHDNFAKDQDSLSASTFASAILSANNKTNTATDHYYMYLNISNNSFIYTQDVNTPEMILTITSASGTPLTSIDGLTYKEVTDNKGTKISGFDITTKNGLIPLLSNKEISANPKTEEKWNVTITFVNYNLDQSKNAGKDFTAKLMIQKEKMAQFLSDVCSSGSNLANCITTLSQKSVSNATKIYYHDSNLENGAGDNSYRYSGTSEEVNNFVCFGSTTSPCPTDNLYRIIGVFGENYHGVSGQKLVKLIKYDYANSDLLGTDGDFYNSNEYYWNYKATNRPGAIWSTSLLNKVNLNTNYLNNIGTEWSNKIATTTWKSTADHPDGESPLEIYQEEMANSRNTSSDAKIGLMYVSDFMYAVNPSAWTTSISDYMKNSGSIQDSNVTAIMKSNWIYKVYVEWFVSTGEIILYYNSMKEVVSANNARVRPTFLLTSTTTYVSGTGTMNDPIIIN